MYSVYATKLDAPAETIPPRYFRTGDKALSGCISLLKEGYRILSVALPRGNYVPGSQIERAIKAGGSRIKTALTLTRS